MAKTTTTPIGQWNTYHDNGPFPTKVLLDTSLAAKRSMPLALDRYNDAAKEIQHLLQDCILHNERFRAFGSAWSLSDIAHQRDRMHYNARMNLKWNCSANDLYPGSKYRSENLFFFQCGNIIKEVSGFLRDFGKSLKTSGASNGQTVGGALSTGIHGASIDVGSFQDAVVGINLIIGPAAGDSVYIERHTRPALSNGFAGTINARVIRNDGLFEAALIGLGAFGFIHGIVLEAEDIFLLKRYTRKITKSLAMALAHIQDFSIPGGFTIGSELDASGKGNRPFHYKLYVNPYNDKEDYLTEIIYKKPYRNGYPDPIPRIKNTIYKDLPNWMSVFAAKHSRIIPLLMKAMKGTIFPQVDVDIEGTLGEIFWDSEHAGPAFAIAMGIDHRDTERALDVFIKTANTFGPVPGAIGIRFVKGSSATLAFTRFPVTCILEMDGITWKGNPNMISLHDFEIKLWEAMKNAGIVFTLHWGKNTAWSYPGLIDYMYGNNDDTWKDYRSALLTKQMADLFSNDFLNRTKLSDYRVNAAPGLVADLPPVI